MRDRVRTGALRAGMIAAAAWMTLSLAAAGQAPPQGPPAGAAPPAGPQGGRGRGVAPPDRPGPNDRMVVDPAEVDPGRRIWAAECASCHADNARGTSTGPNLVRSTIVLKDRYGSGLGPFLKEGHRMQSGRPSASLTEPQIVQLSHFLRQSVLDTLRASPLFDVKNVLTGDPKRGQAYFAGEGTCTTCHDPAKDLAGIGTRLTPVNIQQRFIFPGQSGRGRGAGAGAAAGATPSRTAITVTVTTPGGTAASGVLVEEDDFFVTLREPSGTVRTIRRVPGTKVAKTNPLQFHIDLLERITDRQMHDVVAYLETLK